MKRYYILFLAFIYLRLENFGIWFCYKYVQHTHPKFFFDLIKPAADKSLSVAECLFKYVKKKYNVNIAKDYELMCLRYPKFKPYLLSPSDLEILNIIKNDIDDMK